MKKNYYSNNILGKYERLLPALALIFHLIDLQVLASQWFWRKSWSQSKEPSVGASI